MRKDTHKEIKIDRIEYNQGVSHVFYSMYSGYFVDEIDFLGNEHKRLVRTKQHEGEFFIHYAPLTNNKRGEELLNIVLQNEHLIDDNPETKGLEPVGNQKYDA